VKHYYLKMGEPRWKAFYRPENSDKPALPPLREIRALGIVIWRQGILRDTRWRFWNALLTVARRNPKTLEQFLVTLAHNEHFMEYRGIVTREIQEQLASLPPDPPKAPVQPSRELQPA
jgi:hypothetical protein